MTISATYVNNILNLLLGAGYDSAIFTNLASSSIGLSSTAPTATGTNITEPSAQGELTTALVSGTAYTSLAVTPLTAAVGSGDTIKLTSGASTQNYVTSAAAAIGAVSLSVTSLAANAAYPVGTTMQDTTVSGGYARVLVANNGTNWGAAASGSKANAAAVTFPTATGSWGSVSYWFMVDVAVPPAFVLSGTLSGSPISIASGSTPSFAANALTISES